MGNADQKGIKSWSEDERPREKLYEKGPGSLSNAELLAILLGSGTRDISAVQVGQHILSSVDNNLASLGRLSVQELRANFKGVGTAKATTIAAALELGRRRKSADLSTQSKITSSGDVAKLMLPYLSDLPYEEFWVLYLSRSNKIMERFRASQGGVSGTVTDVRMILKRGINLLASSVILVHNHPSGNLTPSRADKEITQKIKEAGKWMDIQVLDHLIIADHKYYSFADDGLLTV